MEEDVVCEIEFDAASSAGASPSPTYAMEEVELGGEEVERLLAACERLMLDPGADDVAVQGAFNALLEGIHHCPLELWPPNWIQRLEAAGADDRDDKPDLIPEEAAHILDTDDHRALATREAAVNRVRHAPPY